MELRDGGCFPKPLLAVNAALAFIDGAVAVLAFCQLMRIHSRSSDLGWTRQKVFHLLIGSSNIGYFVYFVFNIIAICKRWQCWSLTFGFISMACPKILFLAAFLLLLSFWIDLCHQPYEEDEEECSPREALLVKTFNKPKLLKIDRHKTCLPIRCSHVGSRQKIVILVILSVFILMMVSAVLIWLKTGKHPNESAMVAKVYIDFFAVGVLLSGGALACYGLLLFLKMRRVRSDRALSEMWKVASLAVTSLICFTSSSFLALFTNIPLLYHWQQQQVDGAFTSVLLILYFFVGSSVPLVILLWVVRELPPTISATVEEPRTITFIPDSSLADHHSRQWTSATAVQNQISRASPI